MPRGDAAGRRAGHGEEEAGVVFVNNRLEGNAPTTIEAVADAIGVVRWRPMDELRRRRTTRAGPLQPREPTGRLGIARPGDEAEILHHFREGHMPHDQFFAIDTSAQPWEERFNEKLGKAIFRKDLYTRPGDRGARSGSFATRRGW